MSTTWSSTNLVVLDETDTREIKAEWFQSDPDCVLVSLGSNDKSRICMTGPIEAIAAYLARATALVLALADEEKADD